MKKAFVFIGFLLLMLHTNAVTPDGKVPLTDKEQRDVLALINRYYSTLNEIAQERELDVNISNFYAMIGGGSGYRFFNDYEPTGPEWFPNRKVFIDAVRGSGIMMDILSIGIADFSGSTFYKTKLPNYGNEPLVYEVVVTVEKKILLKDNEKKVFQNIAVKLPDLTIRGVLGNGLDKFARALQCYSNKQYKESLELFEGCIKEVGDNSAKYCAAIMYLKKQGCKDMKRSERDERAVRYLKDASNAGILNAGFILKRLGIY